VGGRVPPPSVDESPVITGLTSSQGKTKLDVPFHLASHPWLKHEPSDAASRNTLKHSQHQQTGQ
jgi:hypothetical protein